MSPSSRECSKVDRRKVRAEAAAWLARLHGPNRTPALEEGLRQWLAEHPVHGSEFELATDVWDETAEDRGNLPSPPHPRQRRRRAPLAALTLTAVAAAVVVGWWFIRTGGDTLLSTGVGDQKTVILADGSRITLNTNTRLLLHYGKRTRTVILKYGEAYFDVVHNPTRPFVVRAGQQEVIDVGTRFLVNRCGLANDPLTVTVIEGRVVVAPVDLPAISLARLTPAVHVLGAGQLLQFHPNALPTVRAVSVDEATAWLNDQLIFDGTPLGEAAAQFNRYNATKIKVMSAKAATIPVGGVFRIGDSASFARAVADSHHLKLITREDELVLEPGSP